MLDCDKIYETVTRASKGVRILKETLALCKRIFQLLLVHSRGNVVFIVYLKKY